MTTCVLDGELVALGEDGRPSFAQAAATHARREPARGPPPRRLRSRHFVAFDLLYLDGHSLLDETYDERRATLESLQLCRARTSSRPSRSATSRAETSSPPHVRTGSRASWPSDGTRRTGPGRRSADWVKVKSFRTQEVVIGGWTEGRGEREGSLGALLLGYPVDDGLRYVGKVGTGFSEARPRRPARRLRPLARPHEPVHAPLPPARRAARTSSGPSSSARSRSASGQPPAGSATRPGAACAPTRARTRSWWRVRERLESVDPDHHRGAGAVGVQPRQGALPRRAASPRASSSTTTCGSPRPCCRTSRKRPLTMQRFPDGVEGQVLLREAHPLARTGLGPFRHRPVHGRARGDPYAMVNDLPTLAWAANLGTIEFHVPLWHAGRQRKLPANPDFMVFDLDPGEGTSIVECCVVAELHHRRARQGRARRPSPRRAVRRVSSSTPPSDPGRHGTRQRDQALRDRPQARVRPSATWSSPTCASRCGRGRVLIDWSQNHPAKTTVGVYSVRAMPTRPSRRPSRRRVRRCAKKGPRAPRFTTDEVLRRVQTHGDLFAPSRCAERDSPSSLAGTHGRHPSNTLRSVRWQGDEAATIHMGGKRWSTCCSCRAAQVSATSSRQADANGTQRMDPSPSGRTRRLTGSSSLS